jgi:hypothetical protein
MDIWLLFICVVVSIVSYNLGAYLGQKELEDSFDLVEKSTDKEEYVWDIPSETWREK